MGVNRRNGGLHDDSHRQETEYATPSQTKSKTISSAKSYRKNGFRFEDLFNTMSLGVIYHNHKGRVIAANPAAEMILGIPRDSMIDRSVQEGQPTVLDEHGNVMPFVQLPSMRGLKTGKPVRDVVLGVHNPAMDMVR
ncbi:MAG: PAS domain S-box protein [Candidatus Thorarchaeota archaeon]|nr:PAS domain S-box protein [Candidatus Thorarchaeota archaeon]